MTKTIIANFDGQVLVPKERPDLPVGQDLRVTVEVPEAATPRYIDFLKVAADLPDAPPDLGSQHDHYLYGTPKR
jgi:hypothetical protein